MRLLLSTLPLSIATLLPCATDNTLETGAVPFAIRGYIASWRQKSLRKHHLMPLQPGLTGKRQLFLTPVPIV